MNLTISFRRHACRTPPPSRRLARALAAAVAFLAVACTGVTAAGPAASAGTSVPSDPSSAGAIGLCDKTGQPVEHGNIHDKPFVWSALATTPAPAPYDREGRTATLLAYQPRPGVNPAEWSGDQLTASSQYTNPSHPMAQATDGDDRLADFLDAYPTELDGLVQLRLYLGAPDQPPDTQTYAAAVIRVDGDTWSVVAGGTVPCNASTAVSLETRVLPPSTTTPAPAPPAGADTGAPSASTPGPDPSGVAPSGEPGGSGTGVTTGTTPTTADPGAPSELAAAAPGVVTATDAGRGPGLAFVLVLGAAALLALAATTLARRGRASATSTATAPRSPAIERVTDRAVDPPADRAVDPAIERTADQATTEEDEP
jgi:hypothetical protein